MSLRPYQEKALAEIRAALRAGARAPLLVAPTGSGKTVIFSEIAQGVTARRNRALILVHRREILEQTLRALHRLGVTAGQIATGRPMTRDLVQVAMVQTLVRRLAVVPRPDVIIVDEAHHAVEGNSWGRTLQYWRDVPRVGFTATPERLDGRGLRGTFDEMILGPTIAELVRDGWLSPPALFRPPHEVTAKFHVKRGDFDAGEQQAVMTQRAIVGDVIAHYRRHLDGLPTIVSCVSIDHARIMADTFAEAGYRSAVVWGDMPTEARDAAIGGLADGSVQVVTFCDLIGEGVDVPVIAGVIMLRRTLSLGLYLQIVGRALRPYPGKSRAIILDHAGNYHLHGHVIEDRAWSLDGRPRRKGDPVPKTTTCPRCFGVWPGTPRTCPACGEALGGETPDRVAKPLKVLEGELVEAGLPDDDARKMAILVQAMARLDAKTRQKAMLGRAFEYAREGEEGRRMLRALTQAVGYSEKWSDWAWRYIKQKEATNA